jgi:hypothetical protein
MCDQCDGLFVDMSNWSGYKFKCGACDTEFVPLNWPKLNDSKDIEEK